MFPFKLPLRHRPQQLRVDSRQPSQVRASNRSSFRRALSDRTHVPCSGYDHFVLQLSQPAHPRRRHPCFQRDPAARHSAEDLIFFKHGNLLLHALDKPLATNLKAYSLLATHTGCPISPHVDGYPAGGPIGNNDWYANADRTIWAPFWVRILYVVGPMSSIQKLATNRVRRCCGTSLLTLCSLSLAEE